MFNHVFQIHCLKLTYTWKILFFLENPCIFGRVFVVNSSHLSRPSPGMPHLKRVSTSESPDPKWMRENLCLHLHENSWKSKGKVARTPPPQQPRFAPGNRRPYFCGLWGPPASPGGLVSWGWWHRGRGGTFRFP